MSSSVFLLVGVLAALARVAQQIHSPDVETRLNYLIDDWMIQGLSSKTFRQKCAWYNGRSFVRCTFQDQRDGTIGETIFGYSEAQKRYTYYRFDSKGRSLHNLGFPSGRYGMVFTDERLEPEGLARVQTTVNLEDEGLRYTQYKSVQGRVWQRTADFLYVPAVQRRPVRKRRR